MNKSMKAGIVCLLLVCAISTAVSAKWATKIDCKNRNQPGTCTSTTVWVDDAGSKRTTSAMTTKKPVLQYQSPLDVYRRCQAECINTWGNEEMWALGAPACMMNCNYGFCGKARC